MPAKPTTSDLLSDDAIRQRAYFMWESDGRPEGRNDFYWQRALQEALSEAEAAAAIKPKAAAKPRAKAAKPAAADEAPKPKKAAAKKHEDKPAKKATKPRAAISPKAR